MLIFLLQLGGGVALLLWAVRQIQTGVQRAYSSHLRSGLRRATQSRAAAGLAGALAAIGLQSATAVAMLVAGFSEFGFLPPAAGLALILGADVGSAIAAQILLAPVQGLSPVLLVLGVPLFLASRNPRYRQLGRILIGLALVLLSLGLIRQATAPMQGSEIVRVIATYLAGDLYSGFLIGAVIAWAMHSSVAAVLMVVTLAAQGLLAGPAAAALVLGANLGGALIPFVLSYRAKTETRRIMAGNLMARGLGSVLALAALIAAPGLIVWLGDGAGRQAVNLHLGFNVVVALIGLPAVSGLLRLAGALIRPDAGEATRRVGALDAAVLSYPDRALACATRESLRMGELALDMLAPVIGLFDDWQADTADRIARLEEEVDGLHFRIKLYIAQIPKSAMTEDQSRRAMELAKIAGNIEEAADLISSNLVDLARRMSTDGMTFSKAGWREITDFHDRVLSNVQLALNILVSRDADAARHLVEEKDAARKEEQRLQARHLKRLRKGNTASLETSNVHQETVRALKQINAAFAYVAYPIVEESGDLLSTRLTSRANGAG